MKVLDCTLRDGGYYCQWDFDESLVRDYLSSIDGSHVDMLELGFRFLSKDYFCGAFGYTTDDYLLTLNLPERTPISVMVNASDYYGDSFQQEKLINSIFDKKINSPVTMVRVAVVVDDYYIANEISLSLKKLGYIVAVNLMQVSYSHVDKVKKAILSIKQWGAVDVIYLADSFGRLMPDECAHLVSFSKQISNIEIGIHAHDNKGLALANALKSIERGVDWCDATIMGMGRGAGNTPLESLLLEMAACESDVDKVIGFNSSVYSHFSRLRETYGWGANAYYFYAAKYNIHPSYVQAAMELSNNDSQDVLAQLRKIRKTDAKNYSVVALRDALYETDIQSKGKWNPSGWLLDKEVLLIGGGECRYVFDRNFALYRKT